MKKASVLLDLFLTFMKIGLFTFGGGYAMLAIIENICVEQKKWISHDKMMDVTVIAESTPGPIAINCATYIGYSQGKLTGSVAAMLGVVLPSFVIIYVISLFLDRFLAITWIANAFSGIQCAVGILIVNAALNMMKKMKKTKKSLSILWPAFGIMLLVDLFSLHFSSISLILIVAALSLLFFALSQRKGGEAK